MYHQSDQSRESVAGTFGSDTAADIHKITDIQSIGGINIMIWIDY